MSAEEKAHYSAVYAAVLGSDPQRDHEAAAEHARKALEKFRRDTR
jgi:hypothetical protein